MKHLVLNIYANGDYVFDSVDNVELKAYIEYNKLWRFGRLIYVDGQRVYNGCIKDEYLKKYDDIARKLYKNYV